MKNRNDMKTKVTVTAIDPTQPNTSVKLKGNDYALAFTFQSLAIVERKLAEIGLPINVFAALDFSDIPSAAKLGILLYAALQPNHADLTYHDVVGSEDNEGLLTMRNASAAYSAICAAYAASMVEPGPATKNE